MLLQDRANDIRMNLQLLAGEETETQETEQQEETETETEQEQQQEEKFDADKISKLIEEKAQELANKVIGKEKVKMKGKMSELEKQLESEKLSKMSETEKIAYELEKMKEAFEEVKREKSERDKLIEAERLASKTKDILASEKLPTTLTSMVMAGTDGSAEAIMENIKTIRNIVNETVEVQVLERLKGKTPNAGTISRNGLTMDQVKNMSHEEINKNWDKIKNLLNK